MKLQYTCILFIALLYSHCAGSPPPGHIRASGFFPQKILLQSSNGFYVRLDGSKEPVLIADAVNANQADTFYFCDLRNNIGGLQAMDGKYIAANLDKNNQLSVHQTHIGNWEKFSFQYQDSFIVFQALANNLYIIPNTANNQILTANFATSSNPLCRFKIINLP